MPTFYISDTCGHPLHRGAPTIDGTQKEDRNQRRRGRGDSKSTKAATFQSRADNTSSANKKRSPNGASMLIAFETVDQHRYTIGSKFRVVWAYLNGKTKREGRSDTFWLLKWLITASNESMNQ